MEPKFSRAQRLYLVGARIHDIETRYGGDIVEQDKLNRTNAVFWKLINHQITDDEWELFVVEEKLEKYFKLLGENK